MCPSRISLTTKRAFSLNIPHKYTKIICLYQKLDLQSGLRYVITVSAEISLEKHSENIEVCYSSCIQKGLSWFGAARAWIHLTGVRLFHFMCIISIYIYHYISLLYYIKLWIYIQYSSCMHLFHSLESYSSTKEAALKVWEWWWDGNDSICDLCSAPLLGSARHKTP